MKKDEILWADWHRILIGSAPTEFLIEVFFRTIFIYLVLLVVLRLMGKRMGGQLTIAELAVMLTLGAIICVTMQLPDKGILTGVLVLICALFFQRGITLLGLKNSKIEEITQGVETVLVKDGVIQVKQLNSDNISRQQLYALLRSQQIFNLGAVERVYLEACGLFSVYQSEKPRAGLSLHPTSDEPIHHSQVRDESFMVCRMCGSPSHHAKPSDPCSNCNCENWEPAVK